MNDQVVVLLRVVVVVVIMIIESDGVRVLLPFATIEQSNNLTGRLRFFPLLFLRRW